MNLKTLIPGAAGAALFLAAGLPVAAARDIQVGDVRITEATTREGRATTTPWSGIWWPLADCRLARGWNGTGDDFSYDAPSKTWKRVSAQKPVNDRSPLLKYDEYVRLVYGTDPGSALIEVQGEGQFQHDVYGDQKAAYDRDGVGYSWWGHCNGWCAAALLEREPLGPVEARGIRFEVADLKGLLTESCYSVESEFTGSRYGAPPANIRDSRDPGRALLAALVAGTPRPVAEYIAWYEKAWGTTMTAAARAASTPADFKDELETFEGWFKRTYDDAYADLAPHVFHRILESVIGQRHLAFVCDITANEEVWNHPAFAYESAIALSRAFSEQGQARKEWTVRTVVHYATDGVSESVIGIDAFTRTYTYTLVTDATGAFLRSAWTGASVDDHPDFAWLPISNPTGVDTGENPRLIYGKLAGLLPQAHAASGARAFDLSADGVTASSRRANDKTTTWPQPIGTAADVALAVSPAPGRTLAKVTYFEQRVSGGSEPSATRDPLVRLAEATTGPSFAASAHLAGGGKKMLLAYGYDAAGALVGVDEVTVQVGGGGTTNLPDDVYEQNDTQAAAAALVAGTFPNLVCNDEDWFKVTLAAPGSITVKVSFKNSDGDLDLSLEGPAGQVGKSEGTGDEETVAGTGLAAGTYAVRVHGYDGARAAYTLVLTTSGGAPTPTATDDRFEENDARAQAAPLAPGSYPGLACNDDDFFKVTLAAEATLATRIAFRNAEGDLDLEVLDAAGAVLGKSDTTADAESVSKVLAAGTYVVRVHGYNGAKAAYALDVTATPTGGVTPTPTPTTRAGTVTASVLNVRRGPATTFAIVTTLANGAAVTVLEERGSWLRVTYSGAPAGELWVSKAYVRT